MISKDNKQRKKDTREQQNKNHIIIKKYLLNFIMYPPPIAG